MTPADRAANYNQEFRRYPGSALTVSPSGFISGVWLLGNSYKGSGFYGAYPPQYLKRVTALFPDAKKVMHLFSGSLPRSEEYLCVDLKDSTGRRGVDAHYLSSQFQHKTFDLIYADPPYSKAAAARYGFPMINRRMVLQECAKVLQPGGYVVWLDTVWPMVAKNYLKLVGTIAILRSQNHIVRCCFIMQKPK